MRRRSLIAFKDVPGGILQGFCNQSKFWFEWGWILVERKLDAKTLASGPRQMLPGYRVPEKTETSFQDVRKIDRKKTWFPP